MSDVRRRLSDLERQASTGPDCSSCNNGQRPLVSFPNDLQPAGDPTCPQCGRDLLLIRVVYVDQLDKLEAL